MYIECNTHDVEVTIRRDFLCNINLQQCYYGNDNFMFPATMLPGFLLNCIQVDGHAASVCAETYTMLASCNMDTVRCNVACSRVTCDSSCDTVYYMYKLQNN